ncbi:MAG: hypothetical protein LBQ74_08995 [Prevotella sp.]|jgi:hypothetical protein|nr:hypothetical protein [Prevotella sp.]
MKKILIAASILLTLFCSCGEKHPVLEISTQPVSTGFLGNGVEWSAYPHGDSPDAEWGYLMTDEKLERVCKRLDYMKPRIVRLMDVAGWRYFKGVDSKGNPILDFECAEVKMACKLLDYCQKNSITVLIGDYGVPGFWGYAGKIDRVDDPRYVNMTVKYISYLVKDKGYDCIKYYIITNEPNGTWACTNGDWDQWRKGVEMFVDGFRKANLNVEISAPDVVEMSDNPHSKYTGRQWVEQSVIQMDSIIGNYNIHCYADAYMVRDGDFQKHYEEVAKILKPTDKPFIFGEIGVLYKTGELGKEYEKLLPQKPFASEDSQLHVYDYVYGIDATDALIQSMKAGFHGASAWMLDDAMHTIGDLGDKNQLKVWGFWNSLGTDLLGDAKEENIRPWFFTWSLMCRYFTPGMDIFNPVNETSFPNLRVVAGKDGKGSTIALINASDSAYTFTLKMDIAGAEPFSIYTYSESGYKIDENSFPVAEGVTEASQISSGKETVIIPPRSFKLYTNIKVD